MIGGLYAHQVRSDSDPPVPLPLAAIYGESVWWSLFLLGPEFNSALNFSCMAAPSLSHSLLPSLSFCVCVCLTFSGWECIENRAANCLAAFALLWL